MWEQYRLVSLQFRSISEIPRSLAAKTQRDGSNGVNTPAQQWGLARDFKDQNSFQDSQKILAQGP
jgi:hypothetical protein